MSPSGPHGQLSSDHAWLDVNGEWRFPISENLPDDLYLALVGPAGATSTNFDPSSAQPFEVRNGDGRIPSDGPAAVQAALQAQQEFRDREIRADGFSGDNRLRLHVVVQGCRLDYRQPFEGGFLQPLTATLGPESVVAALNTIFGFSAQNEQLEADYRDAHPLCVVTFVNVQAPDLAQAVQAATERLDRLLGALAEDRSATPEVLAYVSEDATGKYLLSVLTGVYRGNRLAGFGPGVSGMLDRIAEAATANPWIDFALKLMRSIRLQTNPEVQLFQSWSLIEAAAKRAVPRNNANQVLDEAGATIPYRNSVLTEGHDLGRVMVYLRDQVGANRFMWSALPGSPDFYAAVQLLYGARNRIAHEGGLTVPGSTQIAGSVFDIAFIAKESASEVLQHEIRRAAP